MSDKLDSKDSNDPKSKEKKSSDSKSITVNQNVTSVASGGTNIGAYVNIEGLSSDEQEKLQTLLFPEQEPVWDGKFPYRGLDAFQENDAKYFFGREHIVDELLNRVKRSSFIVISGPSGSGKSSVARAGLFHALRIGRLDKSDSWSLATMQPKSDPFKQLGKGLRQSGVPRDDVRVIEENPSELVDVIDDYLTDDKNQRFVLLIDQFEEVFAQTKNLQTRTDFINLLTSVAGSKEGRIIIVVTLRSDFISHCVSFPKLRDLMNKELELVGAMEPYDLAQAISKPALAVGATIDPQLVDQVMKDMNGEPGALPLMSFALHDLFDAEKSAIGEPMDLLLPEYEKRGGLQKALERHTESIFENFSDDQIELTKSIFSNLITVGEGRSDTRRTATFADLVQDSTTQEEIQAVVNALAQGEARLITVSADPEDGENALQQNITIAHERLIDAWPWLRKLVDENRDLIALLNQISSDAKEWGENQDEGFLYRGGRLLQIEEQWDEVRPKLNKDSVRFFEASIKQRDLEVADKAKQLRRTQMFLALTALLLVIAAGAAVFARFQQNKAIEQEERALAQTTLANAQGLQRGNQLQLSTLLAIVSLKNAEAEPDVNDASESDVKVETKADAEELLRQNISRLPIAIHEEDEASGALVDVLFSSDGNEMAIADLDQGVYVYTTAAGEAIKEMKRFDNGNDELLRMALSSDNKLLAVVDNAYDNNDFSVLIFDFDPEVGLLSLITPVNIIVDPKHTLNHFANVIEIEFSSDGKMLATSSSDKIIRIWDVDRGDLYKEFEAEGQVHDLVFSEDGAWLLSGGNGGYLWNVDDLDIKEALRAFPHDSHVLSIAFSPNEKLIATAGTDQMVKIWDAESGNLLFSSQHDGWVNKVEFSLDGHWVATASQDGRVRIWNTQILSEEGEVRDEIQERQLYHDGPVRSLTFSPDQNSPWLATTSVDRTARLWDVTTGQELAVMALGSEGAALSFSPDGKQLATTTEGGWWQFWDLSEITTPLKLHFHNQIISAVSVDVQNNIYYAGGVDNATYMLSPNTQGATQLDQGHTDVIRSVNVSSDGAYLATSSDDFTISLWNLEAGKLNHQKIVSGVVSAFDFHPNGKSFVSVDLLGNIAHWDIDSGKKRFENYHESQANLLSVSFNPSGNRFVSGAEDGTIQVWDSETGEPQVSLEHGTRPILDIAFSIDGQLLFTASENGEVKVWEGMEPYNPIETTLFHPDAVNGIGVDPNGEWLATAGADGIIRLWQVESLKEVAQIPHASSVTDVQFSSDGTEIISTSENGIFVWEVEAIDKFVSQDALIDAACKRVTRELSNDEKLTYIGDPNARNSDACP